MTRTAGEVCLSILVRHRRLIVAFLVGASVARELSSYKPPPLSSFSFEAADENIAPLQTPTADRDHEFYKDVDNIGIISAKDPSFFSAHQEEIDSLNDETRCKRYGFKLTSDDPSRRRQRPRRIFFGGLVATEPWELFEIVAAETHGIYEGFVLVESTRTQNFFPRNLTHYNHRAKHERMIGRLFGIPENKTQIRLYVNEDPELTDLSRESAQRNDILNGWLELGMQADDVAILADMDEVLTRDFLRAIQICDVIDEIDYDSHRCRPDKMGLRTVTQVYEGSPECVTDERTGFHPSVFVGQCLEGIADATIHPPSPRDEWGDRQPGWGQSDWDESKEYNPSYNGGDFRGTGGARNTNLLMDDDEEKTKRHYNVYTAYHFHNFFTDGGTIRFKYRTYGHPNQDAYTSPLEDLQSDLGVMVRCARDEPDPEDAEYKRVPGGFESLDPFTPIYFKDAEYRKRRQDLIHDMVIADDAQRIQTEITRRKNELEKAKEDRKKAKEERAKARAALEQE
mmetsp:Transcript_5662/g.14138  ORF Transcript_5662/g.14138 Transcript_5662/m.14138 type:complete len:511 (-) Transcript_5662:351-1883(-)|eukprot:CAMPEP_0197188184 /NCGR_PEP_ID=MMETSP1423-20130617/17403_1 /TAXON_ID=476441 /ORGANISM="Pseudo-nitzschia heimii, Strain UNC1101" /LENGTH=510 /DNA_ID=CAMNT_0042639967 /DNA_START=52 /DNA_END=1584 /DNA_ORIENTATION=+